MRALPTRRGRGLGIIVAIAFVIASATSACGDAESAPATSTATTTETASSSALASSEASSIVSPTSSTQASEASALAATSSVTATSLEPTAAPQASEAASATTTAGKQEQTGWVDCAADEATIKPRSITTDCIKLSDKVTSIEWESWDSDKAEGIGEKDGKQVKVTLTDPVQFATGGMVFSDLLLDGVPVRT